MINYFVALNAMMKSINEEPIKRFSTKGSSTIRKGYHAGLPDQSISIDLLLSPSVMEVSGDTAPELKRGRKFSTRFAMKDVVTAYIELLEDRLAYLEQYIGCLEKCLSESVSISAVALDQFDQSKRGQILQGKRPDYSSSSYDIAKEIEKRLAEEIAASTKRITAKKDAYEAQEKMMKELAKSMNANIKDVLKVKRTRGRRSKAKTA